MASDPNEPYTGGANGVAMGSMWAIPPSIDLDAMRLSAEGMTLGVALQTRGGHVLVQANTAAIFVEPPRDPANDDPDVVAAVARMKTDYQGKLFKALRRVKNNNPGALRGNSPISTDVAGGEPRLLPAPTAFS